MNFDGHLEGDSLIHRIDPRMRVISVLLFSFTTALLSSFDALLFALLISVLFVFTTRLNLLCVAKNLAVFAGFIVLIWLILPLSIKGEELFSLRFFTFSKEGVHLCMQITLKSFAVILFFNTLVSTMNFSVLGAAMNSLKVPLKIVYLFLMTFRYISVLEEEFKRLVNASKIRGFKPGANFHTYRTYGNILGMLFVNANMRGKRVYDAMICRGFTGRFHTLHDFNAKFSDYIFVLFSVCVTLLILFFEYSDLISGR